MAWIRKSRSNLNAEIVFLLLVSMAVACGHSPDQALMTTFYARSRDLQALVELVQYDVQSRSVPGGFMLRAGHSPSELGLAAARADQYERLLSRACPHCDLFRDDKTGSVFLTVEKVGTLLHGSYKGYVYSPSAPSTVVSSLDAPNTARLDDCAFHFRAIQGDWYLYYQDCQ